MESLMVSICVITFNSEKTILKTLESIKNQSYDKRKIELIIADDCSIDNTVHIIQDWIDFNSKIFFKISLITQKTNLGVSKNINSAWKAVSTDWIKTIAGDDILSENCIQSYINFLNREKKSLAIFSYMQSFTENNDELTYKRILPEKDKLHFFQLESNEQFNYLLSNSFNMAPTSFIHNKVLKDVNYADEQFSLIEDLPLWLKITKLGYKLSFNPDITVYYRISNSLSNSTSRFTNIKFNEEIITLHKKIIKPHIKGINYLYYYDKIYELKSNIFIAKISNNRKNIISYSLHKLISLTRPRWYIAKIKKMVNKCIG